MPLYDHIQELRAELSANGSAKEIRQIRRELEAALHQFKSINAAWDAELKKG